MRDLAHSGAAAGAASLAVVSLQRSLHASDGLLERLPIGIYTCDRDGVLVQYNRRAAELWGRSPPTRNPEVRFCGSYRAFLPTGEPLAPGNAPMRQLLQTGQPVRDRELVIERPSGSRLTILANLDPLFDETGALIGGVNCFQDITEVRRTQERLREQEQRLAATYEHAAVAISEVDAEGRLLRVNETVCAITGYSREELLGLSIFDVTHPDDRQLDRAAYGHQLDGSNERYAVEKRLIRKDGETIWISVVSSTVCDEQGSFRYGIRVMQDITARKRAEAMLRDSERRYRELMEALPAAVYTTDAQGRITYFNQAAVDLWGCAPELGKTEWCGSWHIYTPDGALLPHDQCPMAVALKENRPVRNTEAVAERPDGTRVPFFPYPTPLRDQSGALIGAVNMLVDISERKRAELRQKLLLDELNHRVKNTLATVQSLANQTARRAPSPDAFRESLEGRLIALSQAHDQLSQRNWEHADLAAIARASLAPYDQEANGAISISGDPIELPPKSALTFAMIFHELATNAAKYGALSQAEGRLVLDWTTETNGAGPKLRIRWRESGGPAVQPPGRRGFGSLLVERGVESELGGAATLDFASTGVTCDIEVPLAPGR
jgi:PAS domain S-box-containing protein